MMPPTVTAARSLALEVGTAAHTTPAATSCAANTRAKIEAYLVLRIHHSRFLLFLLPAMGDDRWPAD
jgi:hypothetical protein